MAICPKCQSEIEIQPQFFGGLFTCPKCQAVYFTNFDGVPEGSIEQVPSQAESTGYEPQPLAQEQLETYQEVPVNTDSLNAFQSVDSQNIKIENESQFSNEVLATPQATSPIDKLNEVVRYGNSDQVNSPMSYRLVINGLDILQNVNELKEVISDSKLQLSFSDLKRKIQKGQLIIDGLSPAKAAVIAQRMRALNLSMKWELKIYE